MCRGLLRATTTFFALAIIFVGLDTNALAVEVGGDSTGRIKKSDAQLSQSPWAWSVPGRNWSRANMVLPPELLRRGPRAVITRGEFLNALLKLQSIQRLNRRSSLVNNLPAPALIDAPAGSIKARAVANGWIVPRGGKFDATAPISSDDAALAMTGVLGLRPSVSSLALRLRTHLPNARIRFVYAASHVLIRNLGLRYNVQDPYDEYELGPRDLLNVAHGTYMLHIAGTQIDQWKIDEAKILASTFELPELGPNQLAVLNTAVRQLGQPYVWAGETEGSQAEGKGGFDCSGLVVRVINGPEIPAGQVALIEQRTTYTQSAIPDVAKVSKDNLQPGDVIFFGDLGSASVPTQNFHAGIYMGNGWFIHSSGGNGGVSINSLSGWWGSHFSWGRRVLLAP